MQKWVNTSFFDAPANTIVTAITAMMKQESFRSCDPSEVAPDDLEPRRSTARVIGVAVIPTRSAWTIVKSVPLDFFMLQFCDSPSPRLSMLSEGMLCRAVHMVLEDDTVFWLAESQPGCYHKSLGTHSEMSAAHEILVAVEELCGDRVKSFNLPSPPGPVLLIDELLPLNGRELEMGGWEIVEWIARQLTGSEESLWGNDIEFEYLLNLRPIDIPGCRTCYFIRD